MSYLLFNVGCIECGVSSKIVGVFEVKEEAEKLAESLDHSHGWRDGGQNSFEVYEIPPVGVIDPEYRSSIDMEPVAPMLDLKREEA